MLSSSNGSHAGKFRTRHNRAVFGTRTRLANFLSVPHDPEDPALQKWLRSLKPRTELAARYALRAKFLSLRGDEAFSARITELLQLLKPSDEELGAILADAQRVGEAFDPAPRRAPQRRRRQST